MSDFVHLHVHSEYSLLDGACGIKKLVKRVKELGQPAIAITDHGVMHGVIDFYKECKKEGIKPIIGCEVYVARRTRHDKQHGLDNSSYHLILLCKNETGYKNLIKMVSAGFIEGFYSKPRIDRELLEQYSEGLIALSACLAGEIPRALTADNYNEAKKVAQYYQNLFGKDNYYIEIQNHGINEQIKILPMLKQLSEETGIPMVATNDSHYLEKEDSKVQQVLVCIATNKTIHDDDKLEFATDEFYIKSKEEMESLFSAYEGAIENTLKITEQCNLDFVFGETKLPYFEVPTQEDNKSYFKRLCYEGLEKHYGKSLDKEIINRLEYELGVIISMGYVDYYLIVEDFIRYAKNNKIPVGPGRGSGAGSIAAYCIGITGVDPIKYGLLFERFLNPERVSMPDFDIDFCYVRRQEVIDYVVNKYGSDHVAQIITFGTMAARGAIRDVGRALGVAYSTADVIAKAVPFEIGMTLDKALETSPDFKKLYNEANVNKELIDMARKVEGMPRHASTHAAGVVITRDPADSYVPLQKNDEAIVTQFPMGILEELGLLKMDFLGLRNLTVIQEVEDIVKRTNPSFSIENIPLDEKKVFELLTKGQTIGIFQFESGGMKNVLVQLKPEHMEDLIAVISLYRPGPMDSIPRYIKNRHNTNLVTYAHPMLEDILKVTYGCIVYQEQVMQICQTMAGYSYGRADLVRRAMSKKKHDVMEKERKNFIYGAKKEDGSIECLGAVANGVNEKSASAIFDDMSSFASYAFNKSHAAAYALIAYQTAYLKCFYPKEYMAALMTSVLENTSKVTEYIEEAKIMGIEVLKPSINKSLAGFKVEDNNIRFGLLAVKNIGRGFIASMIIERQEGAEFTDFSDFLQRMYGKDLNRRAVEGLIKCGSLDELGHTRKQLLLGYERLMDNIEAEHKNNISGQLDFFSISNDTNLKAKANEFELPDVGEYLIMQLLAMEKESCGIYLSGHPLEQYVEEIKQLRGKSVQWLESKSAKDNDRISIVGIISGKNTKVTRNGDTMAFIKLEDRTGTVECIVFPKIYENRMDVIVDDSIVQLKGRVKLSEEEEPQIICEDIVEIKDAVANLKPDVMENNSRKGMYLKFDSKDKNTETQIVDILKANKGNLPVYFYYTDQEKYFLAPKNLWVTSNKEAHNNLKNAIGNENVAIL